MSQGDTIITKYMSAESLPSPEDPNSVPIDPTVEQFFSHAEQVLGNDPSSSTIHDIDSVYSPDAPDLDNVNLTPDARAASHILKVEPTVSGDVAYNKALDAAKSAGPNGVDKKSPTTDDLSFLTSEVESSFDHDAAGLDDLALAPDARAATHLLEVEPREEQLHAPAATLRETLSEAKPLPAVYDQVTKSDLGRAIRASRHRRIERSARALREQNGRPRDELNSNTSSSSEQFKKGGRLSGRLGGGGRTPTMDRKPNEADT
ncbi:MAG TPA: hypothetical protein VMB52_03640 [Verrucomicrobiae bacterium]|nr:hypothetical protein [Verrucomicrobiae bacterium]